MTRSILTQSILTQSILTEHYRGAVTHRLFFR